MSNITSSHDYAIGVCGGGQSANTLGFVRWTQSPLKVCPYVGEDAVALMKARLKPGARRRVGLRPGLRVFERGPAL